MGVTKAELLAMADRWEVEHIKAFEILKKAAEECACRKEDLCQARILYALLGGTATPEQQHFYAVIDMTRMWDGLEAEHRMAEIMEAMVLRSEGDAPTGGGH